MRCFKIPVYNTTFYYKVSFWRPLFSKTIYVRNHSFFWCLINSSSFRISSFFMTIRKLLFHQAFSLFGPILFDRDCSVLHFSTPLREKCSNTEFFLVWIFPNLDWIREIRSISPYSVQMQENTDQQKLRIWTLFTRCSHSQPMFFWKWIDLVFIFSIERNDLFFQKI